MYGSSGSSEQQRSDHRLPEASATDTDACAQIRPLLPAFHAEQLNADQRAAVMNHIAGCAACAAHLDALREESYALLRMAPQPQPPTELSTRLYARIAATQRAAQNGHTPAHALPLAHQQKEKESRPMRTYEPPEAQETASGKAPNTPPITLSPAVAPRQRHTHSRLGVWFGAIAAMLIVALLVGVFVTLAHNMRSTGVTSIHTQATHTASAIAPTGAPGKVAGCQPSQISAHIPGSPSGAMISGIAMTSDTTGWAVGTMNADIMPSTLLLRYADCAWTSSGPSIPGATLSAISMVSDTDGWAVGGYNAGGPLVLRYSNGQWRQVAVPSLGVRIMGLAEVHMQAPDDVWFRAAYGVNNVIGIAYSVVLHYQAGRWSQIPSPYTVIYSVTPVGTDDFWAIVSSDTPDVVTHAHIAHYSHGSWTTFDVPGLTIEDTLSFAALNDGWAYTSLNITTLSQPEPLYHYDGHSWAQMTSITPPSGDILEYFTGAEGWAGKLAPTTPQGIQLVAHYMNGQWQTVSWPLTHVTWSGALACPSANECWATGERHGTATNPDGTTTSTSTTVLLRYTAGAWSAYG